MSAATLTDADVESLVLTAADDLFYRHGIAAVSMAQIRDDSGVSMRRLYGFAASKSDLIARWLEYRHDAWMTGFADRVDSHRSDSPNALDAIFRALAEWTAESSYRGCGFINTHAESSELTGEHRSLIRDHKQALGEYLESMVGNGTAIAVLIDGAIVQSSIFESVEPIHLAHQAATALVAATPTPLETP